MIQCTRVQKRGGAGGLGIYEEIQSATIIQFKVLQLGWSICGLMSCRVLYMRLCLVNTVVVIASWAIVKQGWVIENITKL